jgi:hypothetical protein
MTEIPPGMKPYSPDHPDYPNAPRDWDGGSVLFRDGQAGLWSDVHECYWCHEDHPCDIIAYTPKPTEEALPARVPLRVSIAGLIDDMVSGPAFRGDWAHREAMKKAHRADQLACADAILAHLDNGE